MALYALHPPTPNPCCALITALTATIIRTRPGRLVIDIRLFCFFLFANKFSALGAETAAADLGPHVGTSANCGYQLFLLTPSCPQ